MPNPKNLAGVRRQNPECRLLRMAAIWEKCPADRLAAGDCTPDEKKIFMKEEVNDEAQAKNYCRSLDSQSYKIENNQMFRRLLLEKEERQLQQCLCKAENEQCKRDNRCHQEENFAVALERLKDEQTKEEALRKQMYDTVPELRELQQQIRRAYYAKKLYAQRLEGESLKLEEKMKEMEDYEIMLESFRKFDEMEQRKQEEEFQRKQETRRILKQQMEDKIAHMTLESFEAKLEKERIDEILEAVKKEEIEDLQERIAKRSVYQQEMRAFLQAKEDHERREKERQDEEDRKRQEFLKIKEQKEIERNRLRAEREKMKERMNSETSKQLLEEQFQREEFEELRRELISEELAEKIRRKDAEEAAAKERARFEMQQAEAEAKRLREEKLKAEKKEIEEFRKQMMAKFAEDERLEQLSNQKRREKEREHRKKIEEMIIEKRARRADEREREQALKRILEEEAKQKLNKIEEEKLRLLRQHGPNILGFLPRGVIRSTEELEKLGEPFVSYYKNLRREPDPTTVGLEPCEEELLKNFNASSSNKS